MKKFILVSVLFLPFCLIAQKHDNVWLFGKDSQTDTLSAGTIFDFSNGGPSIGFEFRNMRFNVTNASMSDSMGNLLFYTNGISIWNSENEIMENGQDLNPGQYSQSHQFTGLIINQGVLPLTFDSSTNLYSLIHIDKDYPFGNYSFHSKYLYYSLIDASQNNGLGIVVSKNNIVIEDILEHGRLSACRHANGIDWWVLAKKYDSNTFYKVLFSEDGFHTQEQSIGEITYSNSIGQAVFSPDGTKYVRQQMVDMELGNFLNIYDFDRCTGELSNPIQITYADSAWSGGVAISPNSRYLYVSSYEYVYQFDLFAEDIESTKDTVAIYDGWYYEDSPHLRSTFFLMQLGPDGKIYISANNSIPRLHVINNPDLPGDSYDVCQHCVELPTFNAFSMPNFPNYRLGPTEETCITDAINEPENHLPRVNLYPNPSYGIVTLEFTEGFDLSSRFKFILYDALGQVVFQSPLSSYTTEIVFSDLPEGLYFYEVKAGGVNVDSGKLVVLQN
jgi:hypothetical protein